MLTAMRYRSFAWPNNPRTYTLRYTRRTAEHKVPMGRYAMQDLGRASRVLRGEGEFFGPDAYDTFRRLALEFEAGGAGQLVHPVFQSERVYFTSLTLTQTPRADYVAYAFEFREAGEEESGAGGALTVLKTGASGTGGTSAAASSAAPRTHTVVLGDTLWAIGKKYGRSVAELVALNPWISNPNLIYVGQEVRVQ